MSTVHLTLTLEISFDAAPGLARSLRDNAEAAICHAMGNGAFTADLPDAEVIVWSQTARTTQS